MSIVYIFGIGGLVGVVLGFLLPDGGRPRLFANVAVGIAGAILGVLAARLFSGKGHSAYHFDMASGLWCVGCAVVLLVLAKILGRVVLRTPER